MTAAAGMERKRKRSTQLRTAITPGVLAVPGRAEFSVTQRQSGDSLKEGSWEKTIHAEANRLASP